MISVQCRIISFFLFFLLLILVIELIRRERLKEKYSLYWLGTIFIFLIFSVLGNQITMIFLSLTGIYNPVNAFFSIILIGIILLLLYLTVVISSLYSQNKRLLQELNILKLDMKDKN